jgi:hypothetical protein
LFLYDAEDWAEYQKKTTCIERANLAKSRFAIGDGENGREESPDEQLRATHQLRKFRETFSFRKTLTPSTAGNVMYITVADCR